MAETWSSAWARRFNANHLPAGTGGGEFASAGGAGGGGSPAAKAHAAHVAHTAHVAHLANSPAARKADLHAKAKADRARARVMQGQLDALLKQETAAQAAAKKSAAAAKAAAAAAKHPGGAAAAAAAKHKAAHKAHRKAAAHHASLKSRIGTLRTQIHDVLAQASALDSQAARP